MFHIVFSSDENYIKYLAVALTSIVKNTNTQKVFQNDYSGENTQGYYFHILTDGITEQTQTKLQILEQELSKIYPCKIQIHKMNDDDFKGMPKWGFEDSKNYLTYYRLNISSVIPHHIQKFLYIDTDMLILCDIRELFEIALQQQVIAANSGFIGSPIAHHKLKSTTNKAKYDFRKLPYYFCAGLLVIDYQEWRNQHIESRCLEFLRNFIPQYPDQDALNAVLDRNIVELPQEYGLLIFQSATSQDKKVQEILQNLKIAHFNAIAKPWLNKYTLLDDCTIVQYPYYQEWWDMALQTPAFCKELQAIKDKQTEAELLIRPMIEKMKQMNKKIERLDNLLRNPHKQIMAKFKKWISHSEH